MRPHGRARISRSKPQAQGVCDRCGFRYTHRDLTFQFDWVGARLQNKFILVHPGCYDKPQENIRTIVLPPDPTPIINPRGENFVSANNPVSGIGWDAANLFGIGQSAYSAFFGSMMGGGGPDAVFFGGPNKTNAQSATLIPASSINAYVGINWNLLPGNPVAPPQGFGMPAQPRAAYAVSTAQIWAPIDAAFLGAGRAGIGTTVILEATNTSTGAWTSLASSTTLGLVNETITLTSPSVTQYSLHRIRIVGDGVHQASLASAVFNVSGPSAAQTGSELGA